MSTNRRPRKPWRVRLYTEEGPLSQDDHTSSELAYGQVTDERLKAERGETEVTEIRVIQWTQGQWSLYERITPERKTPQ